MQRVAEPDLMDDPAQGQAYADADFSEPHQAFVAHFRERFPDFYSGSVLDLGCGNADVSVRFCTAYPGVSLLGIDGAQAMLNLGLHAVEQAELNARIRLQKVYLPDPPLNRSRFDAVISNSLLHHLDDPVTLWQTVKAVAQADAPILIMDLLRPGSVDEAYKLVKAYADDAPKLLRRDFFNSLLAAYRPEEIHAQLQQAGLPFLKIEIVSDRHMLIWGSA